MVAKIKELFSTTIIEIAYSIYCWQQTAAPVLESTDQINLSDGDREFLLPSGYYSVCGQCLDRQLLVPVSQFELII